MAMMIPEAASTVAGAEGSAAAASTGARASSNRAASARRNVVLGQSEPSREQRPTRAASRQTSTDTNRTGQDTAQRNQRKRSGRNVTRKGKAGFKYLSGKENGGVLLAEYIAAIVILVYATMVRGPKQGYAVVMGSLVIRLTAVTMVYFVLFLLSGTKAGKAAMWFGLLVDLGILLTATQQGAISQLASVVQGQPLKDPATGEAYTTTALTGETEPAPAVSSPSSVVIGDTTGGQTV